MIWKRDEVNTNNGAKWRRFIMLKKVEQINDHLFIDTSQNWNNYVMQNGHASGMRRQRQLVNDLSIDRDVVLESRTWTRVRLESRFLALGLGLSWFSISLMENPDSQSEILNHLFWKFIKADPIGSSLFSKLLWHWIYLTVYQCIKSWRNHYEAT